MQNQHLFYYYDFPLIFFKVFFFFQSIFFEDAFPSRNATKIIVWHEEEDPRSSPSNRSLALLFDKQPAHKTLLVCLFHLFVVFSPVTFIR